MGPGCCACSLGAPGQLGTAQKHTTLSRTSPPANIKDTVLCTCEHSHCVLHSREHAPAKPPLGTPRTESWVHLDRLRAAGQASHVRQSCQRGLAAEREPRQHPPLGLEDSQGHVWGPRCRTLEGLGLGATTRLSAHTFLFSKNFSPADKCSAGPESQDRAA